MNGPNANWNASTANNAGTTHQRRPAAPAVADFQFAGHFNF